MNLDYNVTLRLSSHEEAFTILQSLVSYKEKINYLITRNKQENKDSSQLVSRLTLIDSLIQILSKA